jgi:hypothetical protein
VIEDDEKVIIVMELVKGTSLFQWIIKRKDMPPAQREQEGV